MNRAVVLLTTIILIPFSNSICLSQSSTNTPYSYYGIGELEVINTSLFSGMGVAGFGLKSGNYINFNNPASYSGIDSLSFLFDFVATTAVSNFSSYNETYKVFNGSIKKLAFGFRIHPRWAMTLGLVPYSSVGYKINFQQTVEGTHDYFDVVCKGNGGLNKLFFGNSFKLGERLSVGINSSILTGSFQKSETYTYDQFDGYFQTTSKYKPKSSFVFDFGVQLSDTIGKNWRYSVGLTGGLNTKIKMYEFLAHESDTSYNTNDEFQNDISYWIPAYLGAGITLQSYKWTFVTDFRSQYWAQVKEKNNDNNLANSYFFATGVQYCPNRIMGRTLFKRMSYQLGAHFDQSYVILKSTRLNSYGLTMGVVIPLRSQGTNLGVSFDLGNKGVITKGLFKETYFRINLSISMGDIWFMKRRFE